LNRLIKGAVMNLRSEGMRRVIALISCIVGLGMAIFIIGVAIDTYQITFVQKVILAIFWSVITAIPFVIWKALCWVQDGFKQNT